MAPRARQLSSLRHFRASVQLAKIACAAAAVEVGLRTLPLPLLLRALGLKLAADSVLDSAQDLPPRVALEASLAATGVDRVVRRWRPRRVCLRRSLVLGAMLRHHDPALRLGVRRAGQEIEAHAWLEIDGVPLPDFGGTVASGSFLPLRQASASR